ncbi:MAG TPA: 50S ribosomal protein L6 [Alphaproteobacteria bacterium]|nr:50S ribosomal protein L6 [Alphaproteobacteria bacterium]
MSRVGGKPVQVPGGVTVTLSEGEIAVKGGKGQLAIRQVDEVTVAQQDNVIVLTPRDNSKKARSLWGMQRSLVQNMVTGVSTGFVRQLEIQGVGYRAAVQGKSLNLQLGYSHDINYPIPDGITITCERPTAIRIEGIDCQKVGQVAAEIRGFRPPEPYKGKGIRYSDEYVFRKEGKKK